MTIKRSFSLAIVDIEKIDEINNVLFKYTNETSQYSTFFYFSMTPVHDKDLHMDITLFNLRADSESALDKKLNDLIEDLDQLDTGYAIRDEDTREVIVEIEHVIALDIKFDNVKFIENGTYEKIDEFNHLKTEFGICKNYNPNFRPIENVSIEDTVVAPETIYLFSDTAEDLSKLRALVSEKILEINPDFEIEDKQFRFID